MTELEIMQQELSIAKMLIRSYGAMVDKQQDAIDGLAETARRADNDYNWLLSCYRSAALERSSAIERLNQESSHNQELIEQNDALCNDLTAIAEIVKVWNV